MNDDHLELNESKEMIWSYNKPVAYSMSDEQKEIIRKALEFDIIDIRTFRGYRGDFLVQITTMQPNVAKSLKEAAESLGMGTAIQKNVLSIYKIFCITHRSDNIVFKENF